MMPHGGKSYKYQNRSLYVLNLYGLLVAAVQTGRKEGNRDRII